VQAARLLGYEPWRVALPHATPGWGGPWEDRAPTDHPVPGSLPLHPLSSPGRGEKTLWGRPPAGNRNRCRAGDRGHLAEMPYRGGAIRIPGPRLPWEQRITEKAGGFGGSILQGSPSLLLVAFALPTPWSSCAARRAGALAIQHLATERQEGDDAEGARSCGWPYTWARCLVEGEAGATPGRWWRWGNAGGTGAVVGARGTRRDAWCRTHRTADRRLGGGADAHRCVGGPGSPGRIIAIRGGDCGHDAPHVCGGWARAWRPFSGAL